MGCTSRAQDGLGLVKLLHPEGQVTKDELKEYLRLPLEGWRVKEQPRRIGGLEYWAVNFPYIDLASRQERFVAVPEQTSGGLIRPGPSGPWGDLHRGNRPGRWRSFAWRSRPARRVGGSQQRARCRAQPGRAWIRRKRT